MWTRRFLRNLFVDEFWFVVLVQYSTIYLIFDKTKFDPPSLRWSSSKQIFLSFSKAKNFFPSLFSKVFINIACPHPLLVLATGRNYKYFCRNIFRTCHKISLMEYFFSKIVNSSKLLTIFTKSNILDVWRGVNYFMTEVSSI